MTDNLTFQEWFNLHKNDIEQIIDYLNRNKLVPFIGAGMSLQTGMPLWKDFIEQQAKRYNCVDEISAYLKEAKYDYAAEYLEDKISVNGLITTVNRVFGKPPQDLEPKGAVLLFPELFTSGIVITTNFDRVLEAAYLHKDISYQAIDGLNYTLLKRSYDSPNRSDVSIFKIHGDAGGNKRVLTRSEYDQAYGKEPGFDANAEYPRALRHLFEDRQAFLFMGCSLGNDRTMTVFEFCSNQPGANFTHFALVEDKPENANQASDLMRKGINALIYPKGKHQYIELLLEHLITQVKKK